jgi:hypothetical protein
LTLIKREISGVPASADASGGHDPLDSGHRVRLAEAALRAIEARGSEHFDARVLDLCAVVADVVQREVSEPARQSAPVPDVLAVSRDSGAAVRSGKQGKSE